MILNLAIWNSEPISLEFGCSWAIRPRIVKGPGVCPAWLIIRTQQRGLPEVVAKESCPERRAVIISLFAAQTIGLERFRRYPTRLADRQN
jgi:hypothetical protein